MSDGLMLTDKKGTILLCNNAVRNLFGIESSIEGKTAMEALRNAELMELIDSVVITREKAAGEISIDYPRELYLMVTASPFLIKEETLRRGSDFS